MQEMTAPKEEKVISYEVNGEEIKLTANMVQNFITKGNSKITPQETMMFMSLCRYQHLNPFLNEAYIIKFGSAPAQIIVSKEAFMKRAESNVNYDGIKAGCIVLRNNEVDYTKGAFVLPTDQLVGGWAEVYRKDRQTPTRIEISLHEFEKTKNGQPSSTWASMPSTMIRKTAMVNALREAFPQDLGAMYTEDDKRNEDISSPKQVNGTESSLEPKKNINELLGLKPKTTKTNTDNSVEAIDDDGNEKIQNSETETQGQDFKQENLL